VGPLRVRAWMDGGGAHRGRAFFDEGWNRHDVDRLMTFMTEDGVFESTVGPEVCGARHAGRERVRQAFARVFELFPDARFGEPRHFVAGDKIARKSSYFKTRTGP
jgi:taurine dehydrogenase small subunit